MLPIGGFVGGLIGGFLAGLITMIALRHNAANISWKHMKSSIRIWGLVGPIGTIVAFGLVLLFKILVAVLIAVVVPLYIILVAFANKKRY